MSRNNTKTIIIITALLLIAGGFYAFLGRDDNNVSTTESPTPQTQDTQQQPPFNKEQFSIDDTGSPWLIVNKKRPLSADFIPADLTNIGNSAMQEDAANAAKGLIAAAKAQGVDFKVISAYRSYANQESVYNRYVSSDGQANADTYSARPGHSEHQTGLAADLGNTDGSCDLESCFGTTEGGKWLAEHAHEYGFIIRYPEEKTDITGYQYEPWHIRYVGKELAQELHHQGKTMEEFFNLPAAPSY